MNKKYTVKNITYKVMNKISFYLYLIKVYIKQEMGMFDQPGRKGYVVLNHCYYTQKVFNAAYVKNVINLILYYLDKGYTPVITEINKNSNLGWSTFFEQPFGNRIESFEASKDIDNKGYKSTYKGKIIFSHDIFYRRFQQKFWRKFAFKFVKLNAETKKYCDLDYNNIIKPDMRVVGCCCRGSDYIKLKPAYHPVQPDLQMVEKVVRRLLEKEGYTHVYLATEEQSIHDYFMSKFPGKVLVNKRHYIGDAFKQSGADWCHQVVLGIENEPYVKGIEYLSSIYILSKCNALVGGNCGATQLAFLMNNFKYNYTEVFNLGLYPPSIYNKVGID